VKKAVVAFTYVRDCPFWRSGECLQNYCNCDVDELSIPPQQCPLPNFEEVKKMNEKHIEPELLPHGYCKSCRYSFITRDVDEITSIWCRRYPPTIIDIYRASFPEVEESWWCGEFKERIN
jgi:hypothetical protein